MKIVSVFGHSKTSHDASEYREAEELGALLAAEGYVVCSGGYRGIMEAVSRGAQEAGGRTLGITTEQFPGTVNAWVTEESREKTWRERLFALIDRADAYVVFSGGTGTLVELFIVWEMTLQKMQKKPCVVLGRGIRELINALRGDCAVRFPAELLFAESPREAAAIVKEKLSK